MSIAINFVCRFNNVEFITREFITLNRRLVCFVFDKQTREITAEFHKVTPVKPFIES